MSAEHDDESAAPALPSSAELTALASMLKDAGLLMVVEDPHGREAYLLTPDGRRVSRMLAMVDGQEADAVLDALLPRGSPSRLDASDGSIDAAVSSVTVRT